MPYMIRRRFHKILPVLFLASAAQPVYRLGAFIEPTHAEPSGIPAAVERPANDAGGTPTEERTPERTWPVELVALFPAGIGSSEQVSRAPEGAQPLLGADGGSWAYCHQDTPIGQRIAFAVGAEQSAAASIDVVAHPIRAHAPPPVL